MNKEIIKDDIYRSIYVWGRLLKQLRNKLIDDSITYKYEISIAVIVKDEGLYLEEWIRYHRYVGIDHIYIYDNGSADNTLLIANKYVKSGYVTLIQFPGQGVQLDAYNDAIERFQNESKYIAFIDADEFLFSLDKNYSVKEQILSIMEKYPKASGLAINWRMFGSSGHIHKPSVGGVIDNFLYCSKIDGKGNNCIKTVVKTKQVYRFRHSHYPIYVFGGYSIDENGKKVKTWRNDGFSPSMIRINHYFTKSYDEWIIRRSRPKSDHKDVNAKRTIEEFYEHDNNDIYDDGMLEYSIKLKSDFED